MADSLTDFLRRRYADLTAYLTDGEARLDVVRAELAKIKTAAEAVNVNLSPGDQAGNPSAAFQDARDMFENDSDNGTGDYAEGAKASVTMKEAALDILADKPLGLPATDILDIMNKRLSTNYARSSLSPQLSRLKGDHLVDVIDNRWVLAKYVPGLQEIKNHPSRPQINLAEFERRLRRKPEESL